MTLTSDNENKLDLKDRNPLSLFGIFSIILGLLCALSALTFNPEGIAGGLATELSGILIGTGFIELVLMKVNDIQSKRDLVKGLLVSFDIGYQHGRNDEFNLVEKEHRYLGGEITFTNRTSNEIYSIQLSFNTVVHFSLGVTDSYELQRNRSVSATKTIDKNQTLFIKRLLPGETWYEYLTYYTHRVDSPEIKVNWRMPGKDRFQLTQELPKIINENLEESSIGKKPSYNRRVILP